MSQSYMEKYNPTTSIFQHFQVDDSLPKPELAFATWKALLSAKRGHDGLFLVIGKLLKDVRDQELFKELDYENFSQFLASEELGFSREKAYMCIKTFEYYIEYLELDPENVGKMNVSRLSMMVPMLRQIEDKAEAVKQIEEMNNMRHNEFVREVKNRTNRDGKPVVYWSEELGKWYIGYFPNTCHLHELGDFEGGVGELAGASEAT
jgi:hypothetical protein